MSRDLDSLIAGLSLDEKATLTAGRDNWATAPVAGIPAVRVTDGPNGARGSSVLGAGEATAACIPCGSALGATFDPELIERLGALLAEEALTKGCRVLLAPTLNLHRSPLAGRNFECYSEDPLVAGRAAAAFVRGVQSRGVATTPKHLVGNEAELDRYTMSSVIDERALRELYLVPFELAVREGGALGVMTAYNRLNGGYCTENEALLTGILRGEWGFEGFVLSDWGGLASTTVSPRAGLDLEMPGPGRAYGPALAEAVRAGDVPEELLDAQVRRLLGVLDRVGALDDDPDAPERSVDRPEHRALAREAAVASIVLARNDGVLPLAHPRSLAVIGPNAERPQIMGGGSAKLRPHYRVTPLEALRERLPGVQIVHERGCDIDRTAPELRADWEVDFGAGHVAHRDDGLLMWDALPEPLDITDFTYTARADYAPDDPGEHEFTLVQAGGARVFVDGELILDGVADPPPRGEGLIGLASEEVAATVSLGTDPVEVRVEFTSEGAPAGLRGVKIGVRPPSPPDLIDRAARAAAEADATVVIVGTTDEWESEGSDRTSMDLPGAQDELVARVLEAAPRAIIVVNAASPVTLDWAERAGAVLISWFGGQEMAGALADVLLGEADPGGRLPTTFPVRVEHNPSYGNFPGENSEVRYGESVLMGYRWYEARHLPVRYPFGHGLSYSSFEIGAASAAETFAPGETLRVEVEVTNTGSRRGTEVVQLYVAPLEPILVRPPKELKGYAKVALDPGETTTVTFELSDRAFACWDPADRDWEALRPRAAATPMIADEQRRTEPGWRVDPGAYELHVGRSSADIAHVVPVTVTG